jgi:hypothetical protein
MTLKAMLAILIAFCGVTGFGYWRYQVGARAHPVAQFGFIQDPSDSIQEDCGRMLGLTKRALTMDGTGAGSTITLFALGNSESANEPRLLAELEVPVIRRVIEGQRAATREKEALLANVENKCGGVKETNVSPIFQAVKRGVEHLQSVGSTHDQRYLFVQTDGEETENIKVKRALNLPPGAAAALPAPIPNKDVHVMFCGMAETIGETQTDTRKAQQKSRQRDERRSDRLREVWSRVFTNPELVTFEPYCSR